MIPIDFRLISIDSDWLFEWLRVISSDLERSERSESRSSGSEAAQMANNMVFLMIFESFRGAES